MAIQILKSTPEIQQNYNARIDKLVAEKIFPEEQVSGIKTRLMATEQCFEPRLKLSDDAAFYYQGLRNDFLCDCMDAAGLKEFPKPSGSLERFFYADHMPTYRPFV